MQTEIDALISPSPPAGSVASSIADSAASYESSDIRARAKAVGNRQGYGIGIVSAAKSSKRLDSFTRYSRNATAAKARAPVHASMFLTGDFLAAGADVSSIGGDSL